MSTGLELVVKTSALLLLAGVLAALMRRASAASRHLLWTGALAAVLVLPIAHFLLPVLPIRVWPAVSVPAAPARMTVFLPNLTVDRDAARASVVSEVGPPPRTEAHAPARGVTGLLPVALQTIWICGTVFLLTRLMRGAKAARRLAARSERVTDGPLLARLEDTRRALGVRRSIALFVSSDACMPITWGVARPAILLPTAVAHCGDDGHGRVDAVLFHEVGHVARLDAVWQGVARIAVAIWWFNPLIWLAARRARLECERACDNLVLAKGTRASDYASLLLVLARTLSPARLAGVSTLAMAMTSHFERRVASILDPSANRRGLSRTSALVAIALLIGILPMSAARLAARMPVEGERKTVAAPVVSSPTPGRSENPSAERMAPVRHIVGLRGQTSPAPPGQARPAATPGSTADAMPRVTLTVGRSIILPTDFEIRKVAVTNPGIADYTVVDPKEILIDGKGPGTTSLIIWSETTRIQFDVVVDPGVSLLQRTFQAIARQPLGAPQATAPQQPPATSAPVAAVTDANWQADRRAMLRQLFDLMQQQLRDERTMIEIGTLAQLDTNVHFETKVELERMVIAEARDPLLPSTDAGRADLRRRFGIAIQNLEAAMQQFALGLGSTAKVDGAIRAAMDILRGAPNAAGNAPLTIADLLQALRNAANVQSDVTRADTLLALARQHAMTPEMVTLYVAAANGISSKAERDRVFAQPIRLFGGR